MIYIKCPICNGFGVKKDIMLNLGKCNCCNGVGLIDCNSGMPYRITIKSEHPITYINDSIKINIQVQQ